MELVKFPLTQEDEFPPFDLELLECELINEGVYRLAETPFFAVGVSLDDKIIIQVCNNEFVLSRIISHSGLISLSCITMDSEAHNEMSRILDNQHEEIEMSRRLPLSDGNTIVYGLALYPQLYANKFRPLFEEIEGRELNLASQSSA